MAQSPEGKEGFSPAEVERSENAQAVLDWVEGRTFWSNSMTFEEMTADAPEGVAKGDVEQAFAEMNIYTVWSGPEVRGRYITALADKVLESDDATVTLRNPKSGQMQHLGSGWRRGTLVIDGDAGEKAVADVEGGKVIITGNTGYHAVEGTMKGGVVEIMGDAKVLGKGWIVNRKERFENGDQAAQGEVILHGEEIVKPPPPELYMTDEELEEANDTEDPLAGDREPTGGYDDGLDDYGEPVYRDVRDWKTDEDADGNLVDGHGNKLY